MLISKTAHKHLVLIFMKKILLVRHAKAVHDTGYTDFERPLKHSGIQDAITMAERLKKDAIIPQMLVTSPSLRTEATADILSEHLSIPKARQDKNIYEGGQQTLLTIINDFDNKYDFIGLVGHNPGISQMVYYFTGEFQDLSPGAITLITFDVNEWQLISHDTGRLTWFSSPKS